MARAKADLHKRTVTVETGKRSIDIAVDGAGHLRRRASLIRGAGAERTLEEILTAAREGKPIPFRGHAAVFDKRTWIGGRRWGFWEEIAPTAFDKTLNEADVRFLHNHDPNLLLARNKANTLRLAKDDVGLDVDADMAPTSYAQDLAISLYRGDCTQMSFAFDMIDYSWSELDDGTELLRHTEVALWDVSTVTYPAYEETDGGLRMELLAACRSIGFDAIDLDRLAKRLADPDPDLVDALRGLAQDAGDAAPPPGTPPSPPAETTDDTDTTTREHDDARVDAMRQHRAAELARTAEQENWA